MTSVPPDCRGIGMTSQRTRERLVRGLQEAGLLEQASFVPLLTGTHS
jgi:hypothetical protein